MSLMKAALVSLKPTGRIKASNAVAPFVVWPVVTREKDQCILGNAQIFECIHDSAYCDVDPLHHSCETFLVG